MLCLDLSSTLRFHGVLAGMVPQVSAPLVAAYQNANGVILGKTAMHELSAGATSIGPTTPNLTTVLNPYNVTHHPGGVHLLGQPVCMPQCACCILLCNWTVGRGPYLQSTYADWAQLNTRFSADSNRLPHTGLGLGLPDAQRDCGDDIWIFCSQKNVSTKLIYGPA